MAKIQNRVGSVKLREMVEQINICMFCTTDTELDVPSCRPMSAQSVDNDGSIWFFSSISSGKNADIEADKHVRLYFSHPIKSKFLVVYGEAEIVIDRKKAEELWNPLVKTWFKDGIDDLDISLIKVSTRNAHYWDVEGNKMINFFKMVASVAMGKNFVTAEEGTIKPCKKSVPQQAQKSVSKKSVAKKPVKKSTKKTSSSNKSQRSTKK